MIESELRAEIQTLASRYPRPDSALSAAIELTQRTHSGHVGKRELAVIADMLGVSKSRAFGMQTFHTLFNRQPVGKYHLRIDIDIPSLLAGVGRVVEHLEKTLGVRGGQTTADGLFTFSRVKALGSCGTAPVIEVDGRYYENMTVERVDELLDCLRRGEQPDWPSEARTGSALNILLKRRNAPNSTAISGYIADRGYRALEKALDMRPEEIVAQVSDSGLRGRGGAGFPTGRKWECVDRGSGRPVYLVCNADEGEPGTFKDRQIMEYDPHLLIEAMAVSAYAIGAKLGFIYIRGEFGWIADILERAIAEARDHGKLGKDILGAGVEFDIIVHRGAGSYVCGEETALIASIEGRRGNPRIRPPYPAQEGLYGCPTVVNNVETLACVPFIIEQGPQAFRSIGVPNNYGPKIFGVSGHVNSPGAYEFPLGTPLEDILDAAGGVKGGLKAVIVGGLSTPLLTAEEAAGLRMDYDSCLERGAMLGSGGIIVMNELTNIPAVAMRTIEFYSEESCGKCTPCRDGSRVIRRLLTKLVHANGRAGDVDKLYLLCEAMKGTTLCPTGDSFCVPIQTMIRKFRTEFDEFIG